ncbi:MAG: NAD(P)H-dependent glycerol-3-phosphate dehydrogenase [Alphaproteobacteria bacterium]|nr:NAD(P)H-dependent glycerol-3-phosphate dehydrogenase [Alphaproteobacteria bacterium]
MIGAGEFGSSLAYAWRQAGRSVALWCRDPAQATSLRETGINPKVPECPAMPGIRAGVLADFALMSAKDVVVLAVKAQAQTGVFEPLRDRIRPGNAVVTVSKGFADGTGTLLSTALALPQGLGVLSGPSLSLDLFEDRPTAVTLATENPDAGLLAVLSTPRLRLYASADTIGAQICGAMKNVVAIACGCSDGMGFGPSARSALMTRGLRELERLTEVYGGDPRTAVGLAGVGDLALTCQDQQSRNYSFGHDLGQGQSALELLSRGTTVEGAATALSLIASGHTEGVSLPITEAVARLSRGEGSPAEEVTTLLSRSLAADV